MVLNVLELASIWPSDATSTWHCGRPNYKTNAADLEVRQEEGCIISKQSMPEVAVVLWVMSLQACSELQVVESRALPSDSPAKELQNQRQSQAPFSSAFWVQKYLGQVG